MSGEFSAEWLRLREPSDARARNEAVAGRLAAWCAGRESLRIVDLGAGTGANMRWLGPRLAPQQAWTLVERDERLIEAGSAALKGPVCYRRLDLATDLERLADEPADVIAGSALLDLVSRAWLARLVGLRRRRGAALYFALSFDGRIAWEPADPGDEMIRDLVNTHQRSDKGFGPAAGPDAVKLLRALLDPADGALEIGRSDWDLGPADVALQRVLLEGHAVAAMGVRPERHGEILTWAARRQALISAGSSWLRVGHLDLALIPS